MLFDFRRLVGPIGQQRHDLVLLEQRLRTSSVSMANEQIALCSWGTNRP